MSANRRTCVLIFTIPRLPDQPMESRRRRQLNHMADYNEIVDIKRRWSRESEHIRQQPTADEQQKQGQCTPPTWPAASAYGDIINSGHTALHNSVTTPTTG